MQIQRIGVIGGGTAGYLTALGLKKHFPKTTVELIESSKIPVIGVGEASTPYLGHYLHNILEIDLKEFYESARPTWKLGIRFDWGKSPDNIFNYPFGKTSLGKASQISGNLNRSSPASLLMDDKRFPIFKNDLTSKGSITTGLYNYKFAYHLDNRRVVQFLQNKANDFGIVRKDEMISTIETDEHGESVKAIKTEKGEILKYDIYFDCTGFRSLLLGKTLNSTFISYDQSLFADSAVTGHCPLEEQIAPYTFSRVMNHGWCWDIPTQKERHIGYVFSSEFCDEVEAKHELISRFKDVSNISVLRFSSGRRSHFWKGNVVGIGNSHAFVEPLESTGLHMIVQSIITVINAIKLKNKIPEDITSVNNLINNQWDYLRWFLAMHYKFQGKSSTPFWLACRNQTDISGIQDLIDIFSNRGLLTELSNNEKFVIMEYIKDPLFSLRGIDQILLGMGIEPGVKAKYSDHEINEWMDYEKQMENEVKSAIFQKDAINLLEIEPSLLGHPKDLSDL